MSQVARRWRQAHWLVRLHPRPAPPRSASRRKARASGQLAAGQTERDVFTVWGPPSCGAGYKFTSLRANTFSYTIHITVRKGQIR